MRIHFWILEVPRTLRFSVALRIQPHFHPTPKGGAIAPQWAFPFEKSVIRYTSKRRSLIEDFVFICI
ncbi:hypothetical protein U2I54_25055, partial [Bacillus pseudomycoides]|nr:hypothetical protein [Bacillus pseudomycoides]